MRHQGDAEGRIRSETTPRGGGLLRRFATDRPRTAATPLLGVLFVSLIALADWMAGPTVSLEMLYALAVIAATWYGDSSHGGVAAGLAAVESLAAHSARMDPAGITPAAMWNGLTRLAALWMLVLLVTHLRRALLRERRLGAIDPLTGVLNRRAFEWAAERERLRARRERRPLTVAYLDLDGFKAVNDRFGHPTGDRLLQGVAATLGNTVRATDLLCRIGGDEFVVLLPDTDAAGAAAVLSRVRRKLIEHCEECSAGPVAISIGLVTYHRVPDALDEMIGEADEHMYRAKKAGGDRIVGAVVASDARPRGTQLPGSDASRVAAGA